MVSETNSWVLFAAKWPQNRQNSRLQPKVSPQLVVAESVLRLQPGVLAEEKGYQDESYWDRCV